MTPIEDLLGVAIGCIGMSFEDFEAVTPDEFRAIHRLYMQREESRLHDEWERIRTHATIIVQSFSKKKLEEKKILHFPWDGKAEKSEHRATATRSNKSRFEELIAKLK